MLSHVSPKDCYHAGPCLCAPCKVCQESWTSNDDGLCRDCGIDKALAEWACCPCGTRLYNARIVPVQPHTSTCPHAETGAYDPEDETTRPLDPIADAYARGFRAGQSSL